MGKVRMTGQLKRYIYAPMALVLLLFVVNVGVYSIHKTAGFLMLLGILLYLLLLAIVNVRRNAVIMNEMVTFAAQYGQIQKQMLKEFSDPYAITDNRGRLLWFNDAFAELTGKDSSSYKKSITGIFRSLTADRFPASGQMLDYGIEFGEKYFRVEVSSLVMDQIIDDSQVLERDDEEIGTFIYAFLFHDETELQSYMRKYEDETMVCAYIYLDNYDEALESVEEVRRSLLTALIDRKINKYFSDLDAIVRKFEIDKYMLVMRTASLKELKESRFSLLEEVKTVNIGNDMPVTLSIGVGANNGSYMKNADSARMAIELALGRGGDQVVLRDGDSITYYGGKSQGTEKSTRVKARVKAQALQEYIESKERVMIMGHHLLDIDAFGAAVGIYRACRMLNKKANIVVDSPTSSTAPFIDEYRNNADYASDMIMNVEEAMAAVDEDTLLVVVDVNKPDYTECEALLSMTDAIVVLDHHRQGKEYIRKAVLSYIEPYASSTCEMVAEILQYMEGIRLKALEADTLYAGILIDTDNFAQRTGVRTFEAAAYLRRNGADVMRVKKRFREDPNDYKAKGETLRNAEIYHRYYVISECPGKGVKSPTIVASQAANQLLNIKEVKASFVLTNYNNIIYISARSIDELNVQIIMERLGGGGHINMAGAQLPGVTVDEAKEKLKRVLDEMLEGGEI
ncbi:MAG: DHH family phosphoesterase [Eubacteriales bacterium]|nr:DHH family phosphoesterase [Eubacteriales bacterium]